ncbi:aldo-keto reductase family 1 member B1-like [Haliotis rubra]|uniref:aldo-keto reductase family 1 member B1-like n=1 Tax=Haliotis rubra TaxID=36100 RepID=UPI001EE5500B|nr:aldo-keto reductase family 1 member B1-like [Haliotis rubra]
MAGSVPTITLSTGQHMPVLGLGTFNKFKQGEVYEAVKSAISCGYRLIDTAWVYRSEGEVGDAITEVVNSGIVKREDLFITSKLWSIFHAPDSVEVGLRESLKDLKVDYVDLYLMHWPMAWQEPADRNTWIMGTDFKPADVDFVDTWRAMERLVDKGLVKAIGVSNFNITQLKRLLSADSLKYKPANLQIEISPYMDNNYLVNFCLEHDITVTAFSPTRYAGKPTPNLMEEKVLKDTARKYGKTPAQVALRWAFQRGYATVPKSVTAHRIRENIELFDFELSADEMKAIATLNKDLRLVWLDNFKSFPEYPFEYPQ